MTIDEVREKFLEVTWNALLKEPHINESDKDEVVTMLEQRVMQMGGWTEVHYSVMKGIENGYTAEQQFEIMAKVL